MQPALPSASDDELEPGGRDDAAIFPTGHRPIGHLQVPRERGLAARPARNEGANLGLCSLHNAARTSHSGDLCRSRKSEQDEKRMTRLYNHLMDAPTTGERLKIARESAGFSSVLSFSRYSGVKNSTYYGHETNQRGLNVEYAKLYGSALNVPWSLLLHGEQLKADVPVSIVGRISADGKIRPMQTETVTLPQTEAGLIGLLVDGNELYPAYRQGDLVLYRPLDPDGFDIAAVNGMECVVETADGELLLRQVAAQPDGRAMLIAYSAPPMLNVTVIAASPVEMVHRNQFKPLALLGT